MHVKLDTVSESKAYRNYYTILQIATVKSQPNMCNIPAETLIEYSLPPHNNLEVNHEFKKGIYPRKKSTLCCPPTSLKNTIAIDEHDSTSKLNS